MQMMLFDQEMVTIMMDLEFVVKSLKASHFNGFFFFFFYLCSSIIGSRDSGRERRGGGRRTDFGIIVTNLPRGCSWQDLKDFMRKAGDVIYADVERRGEGVVEFSNKEDMERAVHNLDDTEFKNHNESTYIRVRYAKRRDSSRSRTDDRDRKDRKERDISRSYSRDRDRERRRSPSGSFSEEKGKKHSDERERDRERDDAVEEDH
jgi:RNA recognition motif-containing protein